MNKMPPRLPSVLVVGVNGLIGHNLYIHFKNSGWLTFGISHHPGSDVAFSFDLYHPDYQSLESMANQVDFAIICSAITNIERCKNEPSAYQFNVINTIDLIDYLCRLNVIPIFLSTNMVFKGTSRYYYEDDDRYPTTTYGRHKRAVEDYLLKSGRPFLILRLCKVIGVEYQDGTLLTGFLDRLRSGKEIICARDQYLSFTYVGDLIRALQMLITSKSYGIFHISSIEIFSRLELAVQVAYFFQLDQKYIIPCFMEELDFSEPRPQHNSLDSTRIIGMFGFSFSNLQNCLSMIKTNYENTQSLKQAIHF
ncbi:MAG: sugar nucleotide-binding protein [Deltaproteobacteria bacterium]|nr:sugar nucleotide-binding protein [Deltaproteobacteria bacterium]